MRTAEVSDSGGGYELTVHYASITRPGLATPWSVEVRRPGGFDGPVTVASTNAYFDLFDENVVVRATGKRELSQLTAFELILLVTIGDLVQQGVTQEDMSITGAMIAVGTIAFWIVVLSFWPGGSRGHGQCWRVCP